MKHPTFVRIEYWNPMLGDWAVGHAGINLIDPGKYVQKLAARDVLARAVEVETGEVVYGVDGADLL